MAAARARGWERQAVLTKARHEKERLWLPTAGQAVGKGGGLVCCLDLCSSVTLLKH